VGLIGIFLTAIGVIGWLSYANTTSDDKDVKQANMHFGMIASGCILTLISCIILAVSYANYIELRQKLVIVEQYQETIQLYATKGVAEFHQPGASSAEMTDLKYNNYQTQIGQMIREMRDTIVEYNKSYTSKKIMKDNWMFSIYIFLPDDLTTIKMADYTE